MPPKNGPFESYVQVTGHDLITPQNHYNLAPGSCHKWTGPRRGPYGQWRGKRAHRVSWERANGRPIAHGMIACHKCDNKLCVNSDHIYEGTYKSNHEDRVKAGTHVYRDSYKYMSAEKRREKALKSAATLRAKRKACSTASRSSS